MRAERCHHAVCGALPLLLAVVVVALAGCGESSTTAPSSSTVAEQPPAWLLEKIDAMREKLGDSSAEAWWAKTEADKLNNRSSSHKVVYAVALHGDFTNWGTDLPASPSPLPTWVWVLYGPDLSQESYEAGWEPHWPERVDMIRVTSSSM